MHGKLGFNPSLTSTAEQLVNVTKFNTVQIVKLYHLGTAIM